MRARNAGIKKLIIPAHSSYARVSPDQDAIDEYIKQHGVKEAVNTGKVFSLTVVVTGVRVMQKRYTYEQIKARMLRYGKVMLHSDDNVLALRQQMSRLRKEGFIINRIGEIGNIKGYRLAEQPNDRQ